MTASVVTPERALPDWFKICRQWIDGDALFINTETTGRNERAEIVELSVVNAKGEPLIDTLVSQSCCRMGETLPDQAHRALADTLLHLGIVREVAREDAVVI